MQKPQKYTIEEARRRIARFCALQDRCHFEVDAKLKDWGLYYNQAAEIKSYLIENDFLNEQRFANSFARGKFRIKHWGKVKIVSELKSRFINQRVVNKALLEIEDQEYLKTLNSLILKKKKLLKANTFDALAKQKITNYLLQKGYEFEVIINEIKKIE